jgi:hypothetical protein
MISVRIFDPSAISLQDFDIYAHAYEAPGAIPLTPALSPQSGARESENLRPWKRMRAAFELYRTFDEDARALRAAVADGGKLTIPTLAVTGEISGLARTMPEMLHEIADRVEAVTSAAEWPLDPGGESRILCVRC